MVDFHSHILPGVDHGSASLEMSVEMLKTAKKAGVATIVATPHFYKHKMDLEDFLSRRNESYTLLTNYLAENNSLGIQIIPAAEVALESNLLSVDLKKLAIGGTNHILIEMPMYGRWHSWMFDMLFEIESKFSLSVILAHIDRYSKENVDKLLDLDFICQMNAEAFVTGSFFDKRRMRALCSKGYVHLIGSDAHGTKERTYQDLVSASQKLPKSLLSQFESNANEILKI